MEETVGEVTAEFEEYLSKYADVPDRWKKLRETCAYMCWINYRAANTDALVPVMLADMFCESRITDMQCYAWHQPFFAMAFTDGGAALSTITNVYPSLKKTVCSRGRLQRPARYGSFPFYHGYA
jgi:hypothetical protein